MSALEVGMTRRTRARSTGPTRKSAATREKIMDATAAMMEERGGVDFQMAEIAERCGMSKGSLYYYFSNRVELVRAVLDRAVEDLVSRVEEIVATAPSAAESISCLVSALGDAIRPGGPLVLSMLSAAGQRDDEPAAGSGRSVAGASSTRVATAPAASRAATGASTASRAAAVPASARVEESRLERIVAILAAQIERAKGEGLVREDVNSRMAAAAVAGAFLVFEHVAPGDTTARPDDVIHDVMSLALCGIGTEAGRERFAGRCG